LDEFLDMRNRAAEHVSEMGFPAVLLEHPNGSSLSYAWRDDYAYLCWIDPLNDSYSSHGGDELDALVFGYLGHWSEAPGQALVPVASGLDGVRSYLAAGTPSSPHVLFVPD
jgi:hypothetical protein